MDIKGYYQTLGVPENASQDDIKAAFRKQAIKWHPDRWVNGTDAEKKTAEENFKKLNEANNVLSDPSKRQAYDMGMVDGMGPNTAQTDPFEEIFRNFGMGSYARQKKEKQKPIIKGENIQVEVVLTMEEANSGVRKKIQIPVRKPCSHCNGTGLGKGGKVENCQYCGGSGIYRQTRVEGFASFSFEQDCPYCHRTGKKITNPCPHCGGTGLDHNTTLETVEIDIPAGLAPGDTINIQGAGGYPPYGEGIRGDCFIRVGVDFPEGYSTDYAFDRSVRYKMKVPFYDSLLGCEKEVTLPDGTKKKIKLNEGTLQGKTYSFRNAGMKMMNGITPGYFIVEVEYTAPEKLTPEQKDLLKQFKNTIK